MKFDVLHSPLPERGFCPGLSFSWPPGDSSVQPPARPLSLLFMMAHWARRPNLTHLKSVPRCLLRFMLVPASMARFASGPGDRVPLWRQHDSAVMECIHVIILQLSESGAFFALLYLSTVSRVCWMTNVVNWVGPPNEYFRAEVYSNKVIDTRIQVKGPARKPG